MPGEVGELLVEAFRIFQEGSVYYSFVPGCFGGRAHVEYVPGHRREHYGVLIAVCDQHRECHLVFDLSAKTVADPTLVLGGCN